jgi:hypothetical protein
MAALEFDVHPKRHGSRPERVLLPGFAETPQQGQAASPSHERCRPLTDGPSADAWQREERPSFDWDGAVDLYASEVWKRARTGSPSSRDAMEVCQLVWLRLELVTRDNPAPEHLSDWLLQEVDQECSRHPHWVD